MTEKRQISTKALSAYLRSRHTSLSAALTRTGQGQDAVDGDTVSDDVSGRIARFLGLTPEQLAEATQHHATA